MSKDPAYLCTGGNSGYQAVNLAFLLGADPIYLLGYDMKIGPNGQKHWHPDHAGRNPGEVQLNTWAENFETMLPDLDGVSVVNCSRETAIECFPRARIEDVL